MTHKRNFKGIVFLLPSLVGFSVFYLIPFIMAFYYTIVAQGVNANFVGLQYYIELLKNDIFINAFKNTGLFIGICVPISMICSLGIAMGIKILQSQKRLLQCIVLIPMIIPTASIAFFWKQFFSMQGLFNKILSLVGVGEIDWLNSKYALGIMIYIFIWKNIGYNTILFTAGLYNIPNTYYESAAIEGAGSMAQFRYITWIYLFPTTALVFIMSIINCFKVFKEMYLIAGGYPNNSIYMIQHYMNNMFLSLNYQKLSTSAYVLVFFILMLMFILRLGQRGTRDED